MSGAKFLADRVAIVTGGSSGIGFAIARALAQEGASVVICARNEERLSRAFKQIEKEGSPLMAIPADVSKPREVDRLVSMTVQRFGRIDILVNNAGIGSHGEIDKITEESWEKTFAVNVGGVFLCTRAVFPLMKRQKSGYIIDISSLAGKTGMGGASAYSASKFAVIGFTQALLEEGVPYNIRATAICPAYVATPMVSGATVPASEMIQPEDVGRTVLYLLSLSPHAIVREVVIERKGAIG